MRAHQVGPVRGRDVLLAAITGVLVAASSVQSFANSAGWVLGQPLIASMYAASIASAVLVVLTGVPQVMARKGEAFWEGGVLTRVLVTASFCACASLIVAMALVQLFGTPPAR